MFPSLQSSQISGNALIKLHKKVVRTRSILRRVWDSNGIVERDCPICNMPLHRRCGQLITRKIIIVGRLYNLDYVSGICQNTE